MPEIKNPKIELNWLKTIIKVVTFVQDSYENHTAATLLFPLNTKALEKLQKIQLITNTRKLSFTNNQTQAPIKFKIIPMRAENPNP